MNNDDLAKTIVDKIRTHAPPDAASDITLETPLTELGIHSLELAEIIFDLEDEFGIEIEMNTSDAWDNLSNVGEIVDAVRELIRQKA